MSNSPETSRQLFFKEVDNCYWNPKLKIKVLPSGDRTVVTEGPLHEGEPLVIMNKGLNINEETCLKYSKEDLSLFSRTLVISAYLYQFYTGHTDRYPSGCDIYFNSLPTYEWYADNHEMLKVYLSLNNEQRNKLKDHLFLFEYIDKMLDWIKKIPNHKPDVNQAIRSVLIATTRTWSSIGMLPFMDFFNHAYDGSLLANEGTSISASHAYAPGDEVHISYGLKDSLQLLTIYGFLPEEKTVAINRPKLNRFAIACDPYFDGYQDFSAENTFLINDTLHTFDYFISHFRLAVFQKQDIMYVNDLRTEYKQRINAENELQAIKLGLVFVEETVKTLKLLKEKMSNATNSLPISFEKDFQGKFKILEKLHKRLHTHWYSILDEEAK